jgi:hypothetical protein
MNGSVDSSRTGVSWSSCVSVMLSSSHLPKVVPFLWRCHEASFRADSNTPQFGTITEAATAARQIQFVFRATF